ncbi:unnamed protein product [Acanthoscelides obtectus]|uniref:Neuropathy target esterase sws n=1 Tax=Acanthoscelides obtectus TaxID=200917 RepID=A0A9P0PPR6_ACAOB|nr:unnamed protein product [Acanthoscelides obtectus]CAK1629521.1 Neuropathy target esterase sws [Acanthoscelides obtectus]
MDVLGAIKNFNTDLGVISETSWIGNLFMYLQETYEVFYVSLLGLVFVIISITVFCIRKCTKKVFNQKEETTQDQITRFRKRDKALFYGRKMIRKVKNISGQVRNSGQGKKRKLVMKFARRILQLKKDTDQEQLKVLEPPAEYLQEDMLNDERMPPDALYMLQSIRVFGHFEKPIFLKLCKHTEIINVHSGSYLFRIGDPDENVYIVQSGKLNVFITSQEGTTTLKIVKPGESVTSLLSFTDVLTGQTNPYKTVSAKALEDSTVVKLPMMAFQEIFEEYPDIFIRVLQVIMVRLQRVTFTALHQYLGLSAELVRQHPKPKNVMAGSPLKRKRDDGSSAETPFAATLPIPVPGHQRRHSMLDGKSFSPSYNTPPSDAPADAENLNTPPDLQKKRHSFPGRIEEDDLIELATEAFAKELGLEDISILEDRVEIREVSAGTYLMKEDSNKDAALAYVISGALVVSQRMTESEEEVHMFTAYHGEIVGGLTVLTGEPSFFTIRAKHFTRLALISKTTFYAIMKEEPRVVLYVAHLVVKRLSPFVRQVDFALDWIFVESGRAIYRQDDESDSTYIVLSGRLRSVITHKNGKKELVGEYGKGDLIGVVEMVTQTKRSTTVIAVRDSELAKLPEGLFNVIKLRYPIVVTRLITLLGHRILGQTLRLTSEVVRKTLGTTIIDPNNEYRLSSWLAQQEDQHKISLYQCDLTVTAWTLRCIRQADCILIVGLGDNHPSLGKVEKEIERLAIRTQKELVLLHREGGKPENTIGWLNMRTWVSSHHHILCPNRLFSRKSLYRINELYSKVCSQEPNIHTDFSRLARWLTGKSVGLVLGGGGARGSAHVGMIKAIQESGIPIDMVGGVSIGAFMGALWAQERNVTTVTQKAREWSKKMTQWWRQILDLTYPMTSMFSGREFNQTIRATFADTYIEDLWLPYFTVTTDITSSCMRIHTHGSLWRYVRSSMSLSGYMPPLCDPHDGHLLLDGGYVNNLPADVMRSLGANHILAVDVGSVDDQDLTNYGDDLSGWWLLWKRWNPFASPVKVPNLPDIQSRLAYVSCVRQLEEVKNSDYCEYIRPPIDQYKTLQFGAFDEIREVGYRHAKAYFEGQTRAGILPLFRYNVTQGDAEQDRHKAQHSLGSYTFTDLAQMVCKVSRPYEEEDSTSSSSDEDERGGYASEPTVGVSDYSRQMSWHGTLPTPSP